MQALKRFNGEESGSLVFTGDETSGSQDRVESMVIQGAELGGLRVIWGPGTIGAPGQPRRAPCRHSEGGEKYALPWSFMKTAELWRF